MKTLPQRTQAIDCVFNLNDLFDHIEFGATTCIGSKFDRQVASLALVTFGHMHCHIAWHYQFVLSWSLHQPESHQLSLKKGLVVS